MKIRFHHILIISFITTSVISGSAYAQDYAQPESEISDSEFEKIDFEKILYSPGEADTRYIPPSSSATNSKDSIVTTTQQPALKIKVEKQAPTPKPTVEKQSKEEDDDSILSFNFLYYIIQKYKLQDIVD